MSNPALLDVRDPILDDLPTEWNAVDGETLALLRMKGGYYTADQTRLLNQIAASRWFLLRNVGPHGTAWRCGRCKAIHAHFTLHCVERPFNGLTHALGVMAERIGPDMVFSAVALGAVDPITRTKAKALYEKLRGLGYSRTELIGA